MPPDNHHPQAKPPWSIERARRLYNLANWSGGYFDINAEGHLLAKLDGNTAHAGVDLFALALELKHQGLAPPVLVRFPHILRARVKRLNSAFASAMQGVDYRGEYVPAYPIKVNQRCSVVEQILSNGDGPVGLEAGSKPELLAVLALSEGKDAVVICNGYKDREYVRFALIGRRLGHRVYIVIDRPSELDLVVEASRALNVSPLLGMRVRLASIAKGKWQNTGGERAKFGLSATQAIRLLERLDGEGLLGSMQLLHFHMGSQIPDIRDIQHGLREGSRYYAELWARHAPINVIDVGGGLGIDYEGTSSLAFCSMNYSVEEYADAVVSAITERCKAENVPCPDIVTEAGRAMTAHHAVLITEVIDVEYAAKEPRAVAGDQPKALNELWRLAHEHAGRHVSDLYQAASEVLSEVHAAYMEGELDLAARAQAEQLFYGICRKLLERPDVSRDLEVLEALRQRLADNYFCNFSIFQSVPDVWAFNQIFPIVPVQRLQEIPTRRAILHDLTCDSDGQIQSYVDAMGIESTLPVHELRGEEPYFLGLFLVGAYQEILGDEHNLFGLTHAVNVDLRPDGSHRVREPQRGDRVGDLLRAVNYDPEALLTAYRHKLARAALPSAEQDGFLHELSAGLSGYTYLED